MNHSAFDAQLTWAGGLMEINTQIDRGEAYPGLGHQCVSGRGVGQSGEHTSVRPIQMRRTYKFLPPRHNELYPIRKDREV